ncbi:serine hydrolase [Paenibacillus sp. S-38]|uniref:serine hydrolase n=1 Tax=Paenibacillus sp. S-38 TaxID=3416710 RepID=UPI003CE9F469
MRNPRLLRKAAAVLAFTLIAGVSAPSEGSAAVPGSAPGTITAGDVEQFTDAFFDRTDIKGNMAGAVIAVVKDDEVLLKKGYGYADIQHKRPVDPDKTVFRLASVSKVITAAAVMQLAEQGKIDLNRDMSSYLGELRIPNQTDTPLTMKHLLTNSTGFESGDAPGDTTTDLAQEISLGQYLQEHVPTVTRTPGAFYRYDNLAFTIQGYAVEQVTGQPFGAYLKEHIFQPLGMTRTDIRLTPEIIEELAIPYDVLGQAMETYATVPTELPGGGMLSTGSDMANFMMAQLGGGKLGSERILKAETTEEMLKPQLAIHPKLPNMAYGYEYSNRQIYNGRNVVEKGGDLYGYHSTMWLLPEQKVGVFIAVNKDAEFRTDLFESFMDRYYPDETAGPSPVKALQEPLAPFEGMYGDLRNRMWTIRIHAEEGKLKVKDLLGEHTLTPIEPNLFQDEKGVQAAFKLDDRGAVTAFYYDAKSDSWAQKLPEPQRYADVGADHPYAGYIYHLRQLGVMNENAAAANVFDPDRPITRGEFVDWFMGWSGVGSSQKKSVFSDTVHSANAERIQAAYEFGLIDGTEGARFDPDRPITRGEAALIAWRLASKELRAVPKEVKLTGETESWSLEGVRFAAAKGLYGPEVTPAADGSIDYQSERPMLRKEAAALLSRFADNLF